MRNIYGDLQLYYVYSVVKCQCRKTLQYEYSVIHRGRKTCVIIIAAQQIYVEKHCSMYTFPSISLDNALYYVHLHCRSNNKYSAQCIQLNSIHIVSDCLMIARLGSPASRNHKVQNPDQMFTAVYIYCQNKIISKCQTILLFKIVRIIKLMKWLRKKLNIYSILVRKPINLFLLLT